MIDALHSQVARPVATPTAVGAGAPESIGSANQKRSASISNASHTKQVVSDQSGAKKEIKNGVDLNSPEVQKMLSELKSRDIEVKAHEQAHLAVAGQYAISGANYSYQTGPDGKQYAIGGDVGIDTSAIDGDPQATLSKAQQVYAAAMAPAQPSSQDFKVAQSAQNMMSKALSDMQIEHLQGVDGKVNSKNGISDVNATVKTTDKNNQAINRYQMVEVSTNSQSGLMGGWQNNANRIGLSFQA